MVALINASIKIRSALGIMLHYFITTKSTSWCASAFFVCNVSVFAI